MNNLTSCYLFDKIATAGSLLYLLMPNILFLLGWITPVFAIPLTILIIIGTYSIWRSSKPSIRKNATIKQPYSLKEYIFLTITLLLILVFVDLIGLHGHVQQSVDFTARNAFYSALSNEGWPIFSSRGEYFIYYHAFWLPPAYLSRFIGTYISPSSILFIWTYLGLGLLACVLFSRYRGKVLLFLLMLFMMGSIWELLNLPYELSKQAAVTNPAANLYVNIFHYMGFGTKMRYFHPWGNVVYLINHAIPTLLCLGLLFSKLIPVKYHLPISALLILCSPFAAIALLPWLAFVYLSKPQKVRELLKSPVFWLFTVFVAFIAPYFLGQSNPENTGGAARLLWQYSDSYSMLPEAFRNPWVRMVRYLIIISGALVPFLFLLKKKIRKTALYKTYTIIVLTIPIIWIGFHNNELLFKASLNMFFILTLLVFTQWKVSTCLRKIVIFVFLFLTCAHIYTDAKRRHFTSYSWEPSITQQNIRNDWQGHLNHPDHYWYKHFWGKVLIPQVYYDSAGASFITPSSLSQKTSSADF